MAVDQKGAGSAVDLRVNSARGILFLEDRIVTRRDRRCKIDRTTAPERLLLFRKVYDLTRHFCRRPSASTNRSGKISTDELVGLGIIDAESGGSMAEILVPP